MAFDFFDDIFLLHFPLEPSQRILYTFAVLESHFSQSTTPPIRGRLAKITLNFYFIMKSAVKGNLGKDGLPPNAIGNAKRPVLT